MSERQTRPLEDLYQPGQRFLTPAQAAHILCMGRTQLYGLMSKGKLYSVKVGASRRIPIEAIDHYIVNMIEGLRDGAV